MSEHSLGQLFDEFAQAYLRGESPNVTSYLARAGAERDDLGDMIDRFLQAVPAQAPTEEEAVLMQARLEHEPPLMLLRIRRRLSREAVVDALLRTLGVDPGNREKVDGYYHQLETGLLDPEPVDRTVWDVLSDLLRANTRALAVTRPMPPAATTAYRRFDADFVLEERAAPTVPVDEGRDEVDRLFTGSA
jgi:hypothetical protein